jgi:hypothetical protein
VLGRVRSGNGVFTFDAHETDIGRSDLREIENRRYEERRRKDCTNHHQQTGEKKRIHAKNNQGNAEMF